MNRLPALGAFARFRGGDVAGNSFEEIDGGFAEMRDELRRGDGIVFALGVGGRDEVGRNDALEGFGDMGFIID